MTEEFDPSIDDEVRLRQLGYRQELHRVLSGAGNVVVGLSTISPVVALFSVLQIGFTIAGVAWWWTLPICLLGQSLLISVYSDLAGRIPLAGGPYQWTRRLVGPAYAWLTGWIAVVAYLAGNATIAYLGAPWLLALAGMRPTALSLVLISMILVCVSAAANMFGINFLKWLLRVGVGLEMAATLGIGVILLLFYRKQEASILVDSLSGGSRVGDFTVSSFIAAVAVGGWMFIGFDSCVAASEETKGAARSVPRALWLALLGAGFVVIVDAAAVLLAQPELERATSWGNSDPFSTAVTSSFGSWAAKPFAVMILIAFISCGVSAQAMTSRTIYSIARDGVLPASRFLKKVNSRQVPIGAVLATALAGCLGLMLGLKGAAIGSLIAFGTADVYLTFLMICWAALIDRCRIYFGPYRRERQRLGQSAVPKIFVNVLAVLWLTFEFINVSWPREILAPEGAPWYQIWAAFLLTAIALGVGFVFMRAKRPQDRMPLGDVHRH
ncbi:APC family permease [Streptomyces sp. 1222.5]|uniref:APC family permease n=1 Tax=Streptomyces sp. 1222.5 TaxID=1881026 RepID=UPI003EBCA473